MNKNTVLGWATLIMILMGILLIALGAFRYNDVAVTQPAVDAAYGRYDTWSKFNFVTVDGNLNRASSTIITEVTAAELTSVAG